MLTYHQHKGAYELKEGPVPQQGQVTDLSPARAATGVGVGTPLGVLTGLLTRVATGRSKDCPGKPRASSIHEDGECSGGETDLVMH